MKIKSLNSNIPRRGVALLHRHLVASPYISRLNSYKKWMLLAALASLLVVTPALAYTYSTKLQVVESNGDAHVKLAMIANVDNDYLATHGFIDTDGLDTRVELGGAAIPHMLADDKVLFVNTIGANTTNNFYYTVGNTLLSSFDVITGYDGYVTIGDDDSIELGDTFEVEQEGYIDTSSGNGKNLIYKENAFATVVSGTQEITSGFVAGADWSATPSEFNGAQSSSIDCCEIDTNKFVVVYVDNGTQNGYARVGTVSGSTITWGTASVFSNDPYGPGQDMSVCKLDTDKFVVVYADDALDDDGYARVGSVTGTTISWGTAKEFENTDVEDPDCCQLGTDKFAILYNDETGGDVGSVCVCTVAVDVITAGTPLEFESNIGYYGSTDCCKLDTDKFVGFYRDITDTGKAKACAFTVVGTTPTAGTIKEIDADNTYEHSCCQLDTDKFTVAWRDATNSSGHTEICTVSGTTITEGAEYEVSSDNTNYLGICKVDSSHFLITYSDSGDGNKGVSKYNSFSGTTVTLGNAKVFDADQSSETSVCLIDTNSVVVTYYDTDNTKAYACLGTPDGLVWDLSVIATSIASGEHTVRTLADGTDLTIIVDEGEAGEVTDTTPLLGASVTSNANDWTIIQNDVMPYMKYLTIDVNSVEKLKYQPESIVTGTTLPDETGSNDGVITWGSNPAGIAITIGSMMSSGAPTPSVGTTQLPTQDVTPSINQPTGFLTTPISTDTTHVLYPFMHTLSDLSGIPIGLIWLLVLAVPITVVVLVATLKYLKNQFLVLAFVGVTMLIFWQMGIYPFWIPMIFGFVATAIVIYERKAAL